MFRTFVIFLVNNHLTRCKRVITENIKICTRLAFKKTILQNYSNTYPTRCNVTHFILSENCFTCLGWYLHQSSVTQITVSTASGICHNVTATCCYRGRVGNRSECAVGGVRVFIPWFVRDGCGGGNAIQCERIVADRQQNM